MSVRVELTEEDIPGAALKEPLESHTVHELKWWLLCRGEKAPSSWKKAQYVSRYSIKKRVIHPWSAMSVSLDITPCRIRVLSKQGAKVVDVDGSYLWRKQQQLNETGVVTEDIGVPSPPPSGWVTVNEANYTEISKHLPIVTSG